MEIINFSKFCVFLIFTAVQHRRGFIVRNIYIYHPNQDFRDDLYTGFGGIFVYFLNLRVFNIYSGTTSSRLHILEHRDSSTIRTSQTDPYTEFGGSRWIFKVCTCLTYIWILFLCDFYLLKIFHRNYPSRTRYLLDIF